MRPSINKIVHQDEEKFLGEQLPANAISGSSGDGNDDETFAAAEKVNLFLNTFTAIEPKLVNKD